MAGAEGVGGETIIMNKRIRFKFKIKFIDRTELDFTTVQKNREYAWKKLWAHYRLTLINDDVQLVELVSETELGDNHETATIF